MSLHKSRELAVTPPSPMVAQVLLNVVLRVGVEGSRRYTSSPQTSAELLCAAGGVAGWVEGQAFRTYQDSQEDLPVLPKATGQLAA